MAKVKTFSFNDPPGSLIFYSPDGSVVFDSRYETMRVHKTGVIDLAGRTTTPAPGGGVILDPSAGVQVLYNKVFAKAPYVLSAFRKLFTDSAGVPDDMPSKIAPPRLSYFTGAGVNNSTYLRGTFTNAGTASVYLGNCYATYTEPINPTTTFVWTGNVRCWYAVLENPVDGS